MRAYFRQVPNNSTGWSPVGRLSETMARSTASLLVVGHRMNLLDRPFENDSLPLEMRLCRYGNRLVSHPIQICEESRCTPVLRSGRGFRETTLMLISLTGLGIVPLVYLVTAIPHFAAYTFQPAWAWPGLSLRLPR